MKISIVKNRLGKTVEEIKPFPVIGKVPKHHILLNEVDLPGLIKCKHRNKRKISTPADAFIELCKDCGMSRLCADTKTEKWEMVDILKSRGKFKDRGIK